jgi:gag-polypeptide of LTR copia-type
MAGDDDTKVQKFNAKPSDDYTLWRLRIETALKGKGYWSDLQTPACQETIKDKSTALIVSALGDSAFRVCAPEAGDPIAMLHMLDKRYASKRAASRISLLTSVYDKRYQPKSSMSKYIDEFNQLFSQLESMGTDANIPESHKAPLLLASLCTNSSLESTVAALRLRDISDLTCDSVTADLIRKQNEWDPQTSITTSRAIPLLFLTVVKVTAKGVTNVPSKPMARRERVKNQTPSATSAEWTDTQSPTVSRT